MSNLKKEITKLHIHPKKIVYPITIELGEGCHRQHILIELKGGFK
jgi:hypothetical protein